MCCLNMPTLCFILLEFTLWQLEEHFPQTFSTSSNVHYSISCVYLEVRKQMLTLRTPLPLLPPHIFIIKMLHGKSLQQN